MKAEEFSIWFAGVVRLDEDQRGKVVAALAELDRGRRKQERARETEAPAAVAIGKGGKRGRRPDVLGTSGHKRVESLGCPHCAGRKIVAWGRSRGLSRFRCKSCRRTFNALTKTPMAHLHKKERWVDHAEAMIEGKSLARPPSVAACIRRRRFAGVTGF